jgi:hypothetical protein
MPTLPNSANIDLAFVDVHMPELSGTEAFWSTACCMPRSACVRRT